MDGWNIENTPASVVKIGDTNLYAAISSQRNEKGKPVYWVAPKEYLGKKVNILSIQQSSFHFAQIFDLSAAFFFLFLNYT